MKLCFTLIITSLALLIWSPTSRASTWIESQCRHAYGACLDGNPCLDDPDCRSDWDARCHDDLMGCLPVPRSVAISCASTLGPNGLLDFEPRLSGRPGFPSELLLGVEIVTAPRLSCAPFSGTPTAFGPGGSLENARLSFEPAGGGAVESVEVLSRSVTSFGTLSVTFLHPSVDGTLLVRAAGGELVHAVAVTVEMVDPEGDPI